MDNGKIKWSRVIYPNSIYEENMTKARKDKVRFNFRNKAFNYEIENNILYFTGLAHKKNIKLRIPYEIEKKNLIFRAHNLNGHIGINRTINKIKEFEIYWENMSEDIIEYIKACPKCILSKAGKKIKEAKKVIITKGPLERVVVDGWELDDTLKIITGYNWVIDIIDHFSKFMMSIPIENNNADHILLCLKKYFNTLGYPKILQTDNGTEYKNNTIENFCVSNKIQHIFSTPRHPQTNGVVEIVHKEVRKNILNSIDLIIDKISFDNVILDSVKIHNENVHTITGFKPNFLIKNSDEEIYNQVYANIKKIYNIDEETNNEFYVLEAGDHLITNNAPFKNGKTIVSKRVKTKTLKLPLTVIKNYYCGIIQVKVDMDLYQFKKDENYLISPKNCKKINADEWKKVIDEIYQTKKSYIENEKKIKEEIKKKKKTTAKHRKGKRNDSFNGY